MAGRRPRARRESEAPALTPLTCALIFAEPDLTRRAPAADHVAARRLGLRLRRAGRAGRRGRTTNSLVKVDAATGARTTWVSGDAFAKAFGKVEGRKHPSGRPGLDDFTVLPDGRRLLFENSGDLWLYDVDAATTRRLTETEEAETDAAPSPDGSRIAFVRDFDVWTIDLATGAETGRPRAARASTRMGSPTGSTTRVAVHTGVCWSPDGSRIAFLDIDETPVPLTPIVDFLPVHQTVEWERYPKAGDPIRSSASAS